MFRIAKHILAFISLSIGLFIYLVWRDITNPFYKWTVKFGVSENINVIRETVSSFEMPSWFIYSLPDGLWMFSFVLFMSTLWNNNKSGSGKVWIILSISAGISFEVSQAYIPGMGVFDWIDLSVILLGGLLPILIFSKQKVYEKIF